MSTANDLRNIVGRIDELGSFVPINDRDALSRVVSLLIEADIAETVEIRLIQGSQASANIGHLEAKWRAKERLAKVHLKSIRAEVAKAIRHNARVTKEKVTEGSINEEVDSSPDVIAYEGTHITCEEVADIMQSLRYAVKNLIEGLLEMSRTERVDRKNA